jgi:glutamyl-tRNA synthetase
VEWFREQGFLPDALGNYLALLGWSYDETTTFFTREELVQKFDLSRVSRNPAAFDEEKLRWMNGHYIREMDDARLTELLVHALFQEGLEGDLQTVASAIPLVKTRMHTLKEGVDLIRFLFLEEIEPDGKARKMLGPDRAEYLRQVAGRLEGLEDWSHQDIEKILRELQAEREFSSNHAFQPIRAAVTGTLVSPPLFESLELLGRERTLARLRKSADAGGAQVEI